MKRLAVLLLLGFGISVARAESTKRDALAGPLLLAEADRQLFEVYATTDDTPPPNTLSTKFRLARDTYLLACKRGVARGCWTSMWMSAGIEQDYAFETKQLLVMCRRGELMACRALQRPPTGNPLQSRDLGFAGTTRACWLEEPRCDQRRLRAECLRGFALSCRHSNDDQLKERGKQLAREGCAQGLYIECTENDPADAVRKCTLLLRGCLVILPKVLPEKARTDLAERACKIGGRPTCVLLAAYYAHDLVPQSEPGRARYLAKRFCTATQVANPKDVCFELGGLGAKLARLP